MLLSTKILQNLANGVEFGKKEAFMTPTNSFLTDKFKAVKEFFDKISVLFMQSFGRLIAINQFPLDADSSEIYDSPHTTSDLLISLNYIHSQMRACSEKISQQLTDTQADREVILLQG